MVRVVGSNELWYARVASRYEILYSLIRFSSCQLCAIIDWGLGAEDESKDEYCTRLFPSFLLLFLVRSMADDTARCQWFG